MFKKTFYTALLTSIFATAPAMAGDKETQEETNHPATEMKESHDPRAAKKMDKHAEKYEEDLTKDGTKHPANKMEESKDPRSKDEMEKHADKYEHDPKGARDAETSKHPAHEMGEGEDELKERGQ